MFRIQQRRLIKSKTNRNRQCYAWHLGIQLASSSGPSSPVPGPPRCLKGPSPPLSDARQPKPPFVGREEEMPPAFRRGRAERRLLPASVLCASPVGCVLLPDFSLVYRLVNFSLLFFCLQSPPPPLCPLICQSIHLFLWSVFMCVCMWPVNQNYDHGADGQTRKWTATFSRGNWLGLQSPETQN